LKEERKEQEEKENNNQPNGEQMIDKAIIICVICLSLLQIKNISLLSKTYKNIM